MASSFFAFAPMDARFHRNASYLLPKISNILVTSKYLAVFLAFSFVFSREKINFVSNGVIRLEKDVRK